jgi:hypothetical protein
MKLCRENVDSPAKNIKELIIGGRLLSLAREAETGGTRVQPRQAKIHCWELQ